jgi:hypothetical protein
MEFRSQKAIGLCLSLLPALLSAAEFRYQVKHDHMFFDKAGEVLLDDTGVSYHEGSEPRPQGSGDKEHNGHSGRWEYPDVRQLWLAPDKLVVVTYKDRKWRLGIDQEYEFQLLPAQDLRPAYDFLKKKLDRRLVAALPDPAAAVLWEIPVKLTGALTGSEGRLKVGSDHIVYETPRKNHSRTWRYEDVDNVSTSDPYELTVTTHERAKLHYGSRRSFVFRLKAPLTEDRYNLIWRRLQRMKYGGLTVEGGPR